MLILLDSTLLVISSVLFVALLQYNLIIHVNKSFIRIKAILGQF